MRLYGLKGTVLLAALTVAPALGQEVAQSEPVNVSGVWELTSETPRGTMTRTVTFEQDDGSLTGTIEGRQGPLPIQDGSVVGNTITFTVVWSRGERSFEVTYTGTVDGDTAKGTFQTPRGKVEWTATRVE